MSRTFNLSDNYLFHTWFMGDDFWGARMSTREAWPPIVTQLLRIYVTDTLEKVPDAKFTVG